MYLTVLAAGRLCKNIEIKLVFSLSKEVFLSNIISLMLFVHASCYYTISLMQSVVLTAAEKLPETLTHPSVNNSPAKADVLRNMSEFAACTQF